MADFTDRIKLVFEAVTSDATGQVGKLKSGVAESEGAFGKLKASASGALGVITSSPAAMVGIGVAVAKVAFDLASGFETAALSAQNFATASGLSVEQASRWQEVAGDLGVNTETLEGAVNKLNIAASKGTLANLGIGGDDTNAKLLNALTHLQGIDDATQRAKEGAALFGKSWAQLAPLVEESGDLAANLAAVSDSKVIDEGEVEKARAMRDAMDTLSDAIDDIKLKLGEALIGPITDIAEIAGNFTALGDSISGVTDKLGGLGSIGFGGITGLFPNVLDGLSRATDFSSGWENQLKGLGSALTSNIPIVGGFADSLFGASDAAEDEAKAEEARKAALDVATQASKDAAAAAEEQEAALGKLTAATLAQFNSNLALADANDRTQDAVAKYTAAADTATAANWSNKEANDGAADAQREAEKAALGQAAAAAKLASDQATANGATLGAAQAASIQADALRTVAGTMAVGSPLRANLLAYADQIERIPDTANTVVTADTETAAQKVQNFLNLTNQLIAHPWEVIFHANTAAASSAASAVVGSSTITAPSNGASTRGLGAVEVLPGPAPLAAIGPAPSGGTVINLNVSVAPFANPAEIGRSIADYLDAFYRRNGTRPRAVA